MRENSYEVGSDSGRKTVRNQVFTVIFTGIQYRWAYAGAVWWSKCLVVALRVVDLATLLEGREGVAEALLSGLVTLDVHLGDQRGTSDSRVGCYKRKYLVTDAGTACTSDTWSGLCGLSAFNDTVGEANLGED